jgi:hypothetical protein
MAQRVELALKETTVEAVVERATPTTLVMVGALALA